MPAIRPSSFLGGSFPQALPRLVSQRMHRHGFLLVALKTLTAHATCMVYYLQHTLRLCHWESKRLGTQNAQHQGGKGKKSASKG